MQKILNKLPSFTTSYLKIALLVSVVGLGVYGAGLGHFITGAFFTSSVTAGSNVLGVGDVEEPCTPGQRWLVTVESSTQGLRKNGTPITDPNRTDPNETLGPNDATSTSNFFSLGNDGVLVASFETPVEDGVGADFSIYETTNGRSTYPIESASVAVSQDGVNWILFPTAASSRPSGVSSFDLATVGVPWFQYIQITDTTNFGPHAADADGFDVDAVSAAYGSCDDDPQQGRTISGVKFRDQNENQVNDGEQGLGGWTIYAATHLTDLTIQATGTPPVSTPTLQNGTTYLIRVSGTYFANDGIYADAQYSERNSSGSWTDSVQNYEGYGPTLLDLQIDGTSPNWGSYNSSHVYWIPVTGTGVAKTLELYDLDNGNNNTGSLAVSIYQVISEDVTDSSGNYSLDVPLISSPIYVFEGMQDGWLQTLPGPANFYYQTIVTDGDITRDFGNVTTEPVGNLQITKYICAQDETITSAQRPDGNGNIAVPEDCEQQSGARFGYIFQEDKTDLSPPYPGLTDSTPFTPFGGSTNGSGVLLATLMPSDGRYMLAELDSSDQRIPDDQVLGFLCTGDAGTFTNNYEATFIPEDGTAYCAVFNRTPDTSIVLNEFLPNPQGDDNAAMPQGEWVELYNNSAFDINVDGWVLYNSNDSSALPISAGNSDNNGNPFDGGETIVPAGGTLVVYRDGDGDFSLDETAGDTVRLYNASLASGDVIDTHAFAGLVAEEKSIARIPDGTGAWVDPLAQPGRENLTDTSDGNYDPFVKIWQQDSNHAVIGLFEGLEYSSAEYTITYTRNSTTVPVEEQLNGTITIDNNNLYKYDIFFGSQSDENQTPHTDISNVQVDILLQPGSAARSANLEGTWAP